MAHILATAENFAFGPASMLITVAERLAERGHQLVFTGYGTALQLARRSACWDDVVECDTDGEEFASVGARLLADADLLVSCVDRASAELGKRSNVPVVWLDPLSWWWDEVPHWLADLDLLVSQRSIGAGSTGSYDGGGANHVVVAPILDPSGGTRRQPGTADLLVNFGGGEAAGWYQPGRDTDYPYLIVDILQSRVDLSAFDSVTVLGGERIVTTCRRRFPDSPFSFECLGHRECLGRLSSARAFLTVPGLAAPLEAWSVGTPTLFLPPSNSSQYVQLDEFREHGAGGASVHLRDCLPPLDLMSLPLRARSARFLEQLRELDRRPELQLAVSQQIQSMLDDVDGWPELVRQGEKYLDRLGRDGLDQCVAAIERLLRRAGE